ncbi:hypothetical protein [Arenibaculum pallidiluteum]|uniref:hypothetical protein n=1 Tax=Arenibaculum pallidiluteum TaxID=2812559 RepID=UPI001A96B1DA|nr:hypothetical protein [Arenibaculum pallidiluteum]
MQAALAGALAGFLATLPMTAAMSAAHRRLPPQERYPLPPRLITERVTGGRGGEDVQRQLTEALHYAYGALAGAAYPWLTERIGRTDMLDGPAFGVMVWTASYLGWIPAAGILDPATLHPRRRVALMIAVHLVWGGGTAALTRLFEDRKPRPQERADRPRRADPASDMAAAALAIAGGAALLAALDRLPWHGAPFGRPASSRRNGGHTGPYVAQHETASRHRRHP